MSNSAVRSLLSVQSGPKTLVSPIGNPRSTVHALWRAFVPSTVFLLVYLAILIFMVGTRPLVSWQQTFIDFSTKALSSELRATLKELELVKLVPAAAIFVLAFLPYIFDRTVLGLGHALPPRPIWHGISTAYLPRYMMTELWQLLGRPKQLASLQMEIERLVNLARAE